MYTSINQWIIYIKHYMNYGDHNFIEITQQTKLRVARLSLCRASRAVLFDNVDTAKMHGLDMSKVSNRAKWNLGFTECVLCNV